MAASRRPDWAAAPENPEPVAPAKQPHRSIRRCAICGRSLFGKASNARFCSEICRRKKHAERRRKAAARWKADHRIEVWAHRALASAIKAGLVAPQPCEVCGRSPTDAHHERYDRPLAVRWLCRRHHRAEHVSLGEARS